MRSERASGASRPYPSIALAAALGLGACLACQSAAPPPPRPPPAPAAPVPAPPAPRAQGPGLSAATPLPPGSTIDLPSVQVEVESFERGDAAARRLKDAGMPASAVAGGSEPVLVELRVRGVAALSWVGCKDFRVAGSSRVVHFHVPRTAVTPELKTAPLAAGDTRTGWCAYVVPAAESDLLLLANEPDTRNPSGLRFLALEPGAAIADAPAAAPAAAPDPRGGSRSEPAPLGSAVATRDWSVAALEVLRGDAAKDLVLGANPRNDAPKDGMEFVAVKLRARYDGRTGEPGLISPAQFRAVSEAGEAYPQAIVIDVDPALTQALLSGGEHTGWAVFQVARSDAAPVLRFEPLYPDKGERFLALKP